MGQKNAEGGAQRCGCRVDAHHHFFPPTWLEQYEQWAIRTPGQAHITPIQKNWTVQWDLDRMDEAEVATSILSLSPPGVMLGSKDINRRVAREANTYGAELVRDYPGRYGLFAILPMPDVDSCLQEIEYALDVLKADGFCLTTNFGDTWPGDPAYAPIFDELNRRRATVFFHPVAPACCGNLMSYVRVGFTELTQDTNRAITSLLFGGVLQRCPDIKMIFSHAGGTIPMLAGRITTLMAHMPRANDISDAMGLMQTLHYDVALSTSVPALAALTAFVPASQILMGSDFPYANLAGYPAALRAFGFSDADLDAIEHANARRLIPRLKTLVSA